MGRDRLREWWLQFEWDLHLNSATEQNDLPLSQREPAPKCTKARSNCHCESLRCRGKQKRTDIMRAIRRPQQRLSIWTSHKILPKFIAPKRVKRVCAAQVALNTITYLVIKKRAKTRQTKYSNYRSKHACLLRWQALSSKTLNRSPLRIG